MALWKVLIELEVRADNPRDARILAREAIDVDQDGACIEGVELVGDPVLAAES